MQRVQRLQRALCSISQMALRGWCIVAMMVWPSAVRQDMWSMMLRAAKASSPVVGSSRNSSDGFDISAHAMPSLRFSPPASSACSLRLNHSTLSSADLIAAKLAEIQDRQLTAQEGHAYNRCDCGRAGRGRPTAQAAHKQASRKNAAHHSVAGLAEAHDRQHIVHALMQLGGRQPRPVGKTGISQGVPTQTTSKLACPSQLLAQVYPSWMHPKHLAPPCSDPSCSPSLLNTQT